MSAKLGPRRLAISVAVAVTTIVAAPRPVRAENADPWLGRDKWLHFQATSSLAFIGYAGASMATEDRPTRVTAALTLALGAGVGKELWDLTGRGDASWRDLSWDVLGTAAGVLVASAIDWILRGPRGGGLVDPGRSR